MTDTGDEGGRTPHGRWYGDACGTAFAMELLGERWSLLVVRELLFGPRRFSALREALPGISAKVLSERLDGLEASGVLRRRTLPEPVSAQVYELTPWGYGAERAIIELGRWAAGSALHDPTLPLSPTSFLMSLKTMLQPARAQGLAVSALFRVGGEPFHAVIAEGRLTVGRGEPERVDLRIEVPRPEPLVAWVYGGQPLDALAPAGLVFEGDPAAAARFAACFALPERTG